jgi:hypothetical protein
MWRKRKVKRKKNSNPTSSVRLSLLELGPYVEGEKKVQSKTLIPVHPLDLVFWDLVLM